MDLENKTSSSCGQIKGKLQPTHLQTQGVTETYNKTPTSPLKEEDKKDEVQVGMFPLGTEFQLQNRTSPRQTLDTPEPNPQTLDTSELNSQTLDTPEPNLQSLDTLESNSQTLGTPISEYTDPNYEPPDTPKSRRELHSTRAEPAFTRSRARVGCITRIYE